MAPDTHTQTLSPFDALADQASVKPAELIEALEGYRGASIPDETIRECLSKTRLNSAELVQILELAVSEAQAQVGFKVPSIAVEWVLVAADATARFPLQSGGDRIAAEKIESLGKELDQLKVDAAVTAVDFGASQEDLALTFLRVGRIAGQIKHSVEQHRENPLAANTV